MITEAPLAAPSAPPTGSRAERRRLLIWLFLLFQGLYLVTASGMARVTDEQELYFQVESFVDHGDIDVPQARKYGVFFGRKARNGRYYAPYGPGTAMFALPHHILGRGLCAALNQPIDRPPGFFLCVAVTSFSTSTACALTVLCMVLLIEHLTGRLDRALLWGFIIGLGSYLWAYSGCFYGEAFTTLGMSAAVMFWVVHAQSRLRFLGFLCYGLAISCKAPLVIYAPALALLLGFDGERRGTNLAALALTLALAGGLHVAWNVYRFGQVMEFGYNWQETISGRPRAFANPFFRGLFGLTLSPGKGLLVFAPALLLSLLRARAAHAAQPVLVTALGGLALIGLVFYSKFVFWAGGYCLGPRHILPIVPLLHVPAALVEDSASLRSSAAWRWLKRVGLVLAIVSQLYYLQVSFLEDQAISRLSRESGYYSWQDEAVGVPKNQYKLSYCPQLSYGPRLVDNLKELCGLIESRGFGFGLDIWPVHVAKLSRAPPGFRSEPALLLWWLCLISTGFAGWRLRRALSVFAEGQEQPRGSAE